jgi:hypothetical protein
LLVPSDIEFEVEAFAGKNDTRRPLVTDIVDDKKGLGYQGVSVHDYDSGFVDVLNRNTEQGPVIVAAVEEKGNVGKRYVRRVVDGETIKREIVRDNARGSLTTAIPVVSSFTAVTLFSPVTFFSTFSTFSGRPIASCFSRFPSFAAGSFTSRNTLHHLHLTKEDANALCYVLCTEDPDEKAHQAESVRTAETFEPQLEVECQKPDKKDEYGEEPVLPTALCQEKQKIKGDEDEVEPAPIVKHRSAFC